MDRFLTCSLVSPEATNTYSSLVFGYNVISAATTAKCNYNDLFDWQAILKSGDLYVCCNITESNSTQMHYSLGRSDT